MRLSVQVKPRARTSTIVQISNDLGEALVIALAAPPVDGAANDELVRFLAEVLELPRRAVTLVRGHGARHKQLKIEGLDAQTVLARLSARQRAR